VSWVTAEKGRMKMANDRLVRSLIALAAGMALLMGPPAEAQQKGTIKIATQSPLSGGQAVLGEAIKLGT